MAARRAKQMGYSDVHVPLGRGSRDGWPPAFPRNPETDPPPGRDLGRIRQGLARRSRNPVLPSRIRPPSSGSRPLPSPVFLPRSRVFIARCEVRVKTRGRATLSRELATQTRESATRDRGRATRSRERGSKTRERGDRSPERGSKLASFSAGVPSWISGSAGKRSPAAARREEGGAPLRVNAVLPKGFVTMRKLLMLVGMLGICACSLLVHPTHAANFPTCGPSVWRRPSGSGLPVPPGLEEISNGRRALRHLARRL